MLIFYMKKVTAAIIFKGDSVLITRRKQGEILNNQQLCEIFKCSPQGGMRRSLMTEALVIVSNHVTSVYDDRWGNGILHYTGMGLVGNQRLDGSQNKKLAEVFHYKSKIQNKSKIQKFFQLPILLCLKGE